MDQIPQLAELERRNLELRTRIYALAQELLSIMPNSGPLSREGQIRLRQLQNQIDTLNEENWAILQGILLLRNA